MENVCTLHAMVEDPIQPKIFLEFFKNENENFSQTLICSKVNEESAVIQVYALKSSVSKPFFI